MKMNEEEIDKYARLIYKLYCEFGDEEPDWSRNGYKTSVALWQYLARNVLMEYENDSNRVNKQ